MKDENKFQRMVQFAKALPRIRRKVAADLRRKKLSREKVLAAVVRLLEITLVRVGNDEYAQGNNSFGLTTLHCEHVTVQRNGVEFDFPAKSNVRRTLLIEDREVRVRIVHRGPTSPIDSRAREQ